MHDINLSYKIDCEQDGGGEGSENAAVMSKRLGKFPNGLVPLACESDKSPVRGWVWSLCLKGLIGHQGASFRGSSKQTLWGSGHKWCRRARFSSPHVGQAFFLLPVTVDRGGGCQGEAFYGFHLAVYTCVVALGHTSWLTLTAASLHFAAILFT